MLPTRKSVPRSSRPLDHTKTSFTKIVKRRKLQWYGHVSRSSGPAKTILQGTVKGERRQGRQRKRWERQHQGTDRPGVRQVPEGSGEQGKMEKTGCKIICGAQTTLAVKGLMMMMMISVTRRAKNVLDLLKTGLQRNRAVSNKQATALGGVFWTSDYANRRSRNSISKFEIKYTEQF